MPNQPSQDLHNRGWGFALIIIVLAIAANVTAYTIHKKTYLQPKSSTATETKSAH